MAQTVGDYFRRDYALWATNREASNLLVAATGIGLLTPINRVRFLWESLLAVPGAVAALVECRRRGHAEPDHRGWCTRCGVDL